MSYFYLSDLDLTLLHTDLSLSDYTVDVWNRAVEQGIKLSIATARSYTGVKKLLKRLDIREPMILLDGVMIADIEGNIIHLNALDKKISDSIIKIGKECIGSLPLIVGLEDDNKESFVYPKHLNQFQKELLEKFHNDRRVVGCDRYEARDKNLKLVYMEDEQRSKLLADSLKSEFGNSIEIKRSKDPYIDCYFVTVLHPKGDKADALKILEDIEGVLAKDTTVFGDSHNDLGLFKYAGRKIAVANAIDEIKKEADIILPYTNDEDAVAKFLESEIDDG